MRVRWLKYPSRVELSLEIWRQSNSIHAVVALQCLVDDQHAS